MENIEKLIKEFGEENRVLIENKLEIIVFKIDEMRTDNNKIRIKIDELDKRMYKVENHPSQCILSDKLIDIKSVMDEYKKLGIPFTSTVQSRLAEFKASGKPLEQFLTEM